MPPSRLCPGHSIAIKVIHQDARDCGSSQGKSQLPRNSDSLAADRRIFEVVNSAGQFVYFLVQELFVLKLSIESFFQVKYIFAPKKHGPNIQRVGFVAPHCLSMGNPPDIRPGSIQSCGMATKRLNCINASLRGTVLQTSKRDR
jgi:hypothetical protein